MISNHFVLVRGLIRSRFHWHEFPLALEQSIPSSTLHQFDIAGNGKRFTEPSPSSVAAMIDDIQSQLSPRLKTLKADSKIHLIGISMGGMIASGLAQRLIDDGMPISSLHIINSSFCDQAHFWQRMKLDAGFSLFANLFNTEKREQGILNWTSNQADTEQYLPAWIGEAKAHPISLRNGVCQLLAASRYPLPKKPKTNCHIYSSKHDRLVDWRCSQSIAKQWQCPLHVHTSAGHDLPLDDPRWLASLICQNL